MEAALSQAGRLVETSKRLARRIMNIGENRLELLMVELQEERERLLLAILLALAVAALALLAIIALTAAAVVLTWDFSPAAVLLALTGIYGTAAFFLYRRLTVLLRDWQTLSATLAELRKDRACLENYLTQVPS